MAKNKKKVALNALTLSGLVASQVGLFATPASAVATTVTNCNDSGAGSLRQALLDNNSVGGTTISFDLSCDTITTSSPLYITRNVNIFGPGATELTVQTDETNDDSIFSINNDGQTNLDLTNVEIAGLTIVTPRDMPNGTQTAAVRVGPKWASVEPLDEMNLTVTDTKFIGIGNAGLAINAKVTGESIINVENIEITVGDADQSVWPNHAYGIETEGAAELNITSSYFHEVSAWAVNAIGANGVPTDVTIENSNFDGVQNIWIQENGNLDIRNSYIASESDGGLSIGSPDDVTITNSTIIGNVFSEGTMISAWTNISLFSDTIIVKNRPGDSAFMSAGEITMAGTIIASETADALNCNYMGGYDLGANLATNSGCVVNNSGNAANGDSSIVSWADLDLGAPGLNTTNPTNGGLIPSIALGADSVARDYFTYDQLDALDRGEYIPTYVDIRGVNRPFNGIYDVGAYEYASDGSFVSCVAPSKIGKIKFNAFSSKLTKNSKAKLREFATEIAASGCGTVVLNGYTSVNVWGFNSKSTSLKLASARTSAAKKFLSKVLTEMNVTVEFVRNSIGNADPIASNKSESGRAKNRRVEIFVEPAVG